MMKLSVIVPVYNGEEYLNKSLDSLVNQTFKDIEIIVINDGSTDSTQAIIDDYVSKYPNMVRPLVVDNGGQGRARNFGIDIAGGEYIGFADADDYCSGDMYEKLVSLLDKEHSDVAVCDFSRFTGNEIRNERAALQDNPLSFAGAVWNKVFKRDIIGNIRFPSGLWYEDLEFSARVLMKCNKISYISEPLYYYRNDNISTMRNKNARKNLDILTVFENIKKNMPESKRDDFEFLLINHVLLDSIKRVDEIGDRNVVRELREYVKTEIPQLNKSRSFLDETRNRRIIMKLNYYGLDKVATNILKVKSNV